MLDWADQIFMPNSHDIVQDPATGTCVRSYFQRRGSGRWTPCSWVWTLILPCIYVSRRWNRNVVSVSQQHQLITSSFFLPVLFYFYIFISSLTILSLRVSITVCMNATCDLEHILWSHANWIRGSVALITDGCHSSDESLVILCPWSRGVVQLCKYTSIMCFVTPILANYLNYISRGHSQSPLILCTTLSKCTPRALVFVPALDHYGNVSGFPPDIRMDIMKDAGVIFSLASRVSKKIGHHVAFSTFLMTASLPPLSAFWRMNVLKRLPGRVWASSDPVIYWF